MKNKLIGVLVAAAALTTGCATEQPSPVCVTGHGDYAVKYIVSSTEGPGDCSQLAGEALGVQRYPAWTDKDGVAHRASMAIRTAGGGINEASYYYQAGPDPLAAREQPYYFDWFAFSAAELLSDQPTTTAVGEFSEADVPDADNLCAVDTALNAAVAVAEVEYPLFAENTWVFNEDEEAWEIAEPVLTGTRPASSATYRFENTKFYVSARSAGTTFTSDLTYTETTPAGTCTAQVKAVGLYPAVQCLTDKDCDPCADVAAGYVTGSGINPDIATVCDTRINYCVLAGDSLPGFKSDEQIATESAACADRTTGAAE